MNLPQNFYHFLNHLLTLTHLLVIGFTLFGWLSKKTRVLHRYHIGLISISWLGFGYFYGIGYCFLTDWHWDLKNKIGETDLPASYITYLLQKLGITHFSETTIEWSTAIVFVLCILANILLSIKVKYFSSKK